MPPRLHWFETEVLSPDENLDGLSRINRELLAKAEAMDSPQRVVLDMDSTEIPEGKQAVKMTRLSCHRFRANKVRLALSRLVYNLAICGGDWRCPDGSRTGR